MFIVQQQQRKFPDKSHPIIFTNRHSYGTHEQKDSDWVLTLGLRLGNDLK